MAIAKFKEPWHEVTGRIIKRRSKRNPNRVCEALFQRGDFGKIYFRRDPLWTKCGENKRRYIEEMRIIDAVYRELPEEVKADLRKIANYLRQTRGLIVSPYNVWVMLWWGKL